MKLYEWVSVAKFFIGLAIVAGLGFGGYLAYQKFAGGLMKVGEDTGNFLSGKPTKHGAALGGACKVGSDCKGYMSALAEQGGVACCGGICTNTLKDFANVWYCPDECKGWAGAPGGTCGPKRADGEACIAHEQCANWHGPGQQGSGCDGGRCTPMKKDWAGIWYIPSECVGDILRGKGSC
jgi:hypothetical protein